MRSSHVLLLAGLLLFIVPNAVAPLPAPWIGRLIGVVPDGPECPIEPTSYCPVSRPLPVAPPVLGIYVLSAESDIGPLDPGDWISLDWIENVGGSDDLDARFLDADGLFLNNTACATEDNRPEHCDIPLNAAFIRVIPKSGSDRTFELERFRCPPNCYTT